VDFIGILSDKQFGTAFPIQRIFQDPSKVFQISQYPPPKLTSFKDETLQPKRSNKIEQNKKSSAASPDAKKRCRFYSGAAPSFLPGRSDDDSTVMSLGFGDDGDI